MGSLIYIAAIILIAIISNVNKTAKNKKQPNGRGGMPTFGGGGDFPPRRVRSSGPDGNAGRPSAAGVPASDNGSPSPASYEGHEHELAPAWQESRPFPRPDDETGEGMSLELSRDDEDSVQLRTDRMQRELERLQAAFDGMAGSEEQGDLGGAVAAREHVGAAEASLRSGLANNRQALQNGLVWSEILGPPRSRQPHPARK